MKVLKGAIDRFIQRGDESASEAAVRVNREIRGSIFALIALFQLVSLTSFVPVDSYFLLENRYAEIHNLGGIVGAYFAEWLLESIGIMGYSILAFTGFLSYASYRGQSLKNNILSMIGGILATLQAAMACYLIFCDSVLSGSILLGGKVGTLWGAYLQHFFSTTGAAILLTGGFLITALATTSFSIGTMLRPMWGEESLKRKSREEDDSEEEDAPRLRSTKKHTKLEPEEIEEEAPKKKAKPKAKKKTAKTTDPDADEDTVVLETEEEETEVLEPKKKKGKKKGADEEDDESNEEVGFQEVIPFTGKANLPSLRSLNSHSSGAKKPSRSELKNATRILCNHLLSFDITGEVQTVAVGPVLTTYEFKPAPGVKLKSIAAVQDDLGIVLGSQNLRIMAPIPGKTVVGIEVPRESQEIISLKEIVASDTFLDKKKKLPIAIGKSTDGEPVVADLAAMPHLLVAGGTGSGKSVFVNSLIMSFLYRLSPQQCRMILIDPKMLELNVFDGIPHLISNVITRTPHAINALNWAVLEMENRYDLMAAAGSKNIDSYNAKASGSSKLPYIVIVVDELADLMLSSDGIVEEAITRLAQKARAAGIHLVIATQRPSTDVITGLIKANMPSRISFKVPSGIDSRTVLDASGAEDLIGRGDSLMIRPGQNMQRIHGCYVDEEELRKVVKSVKGGSENKDLYIDFSKAPKKD